MKFLEVILLLVGFAIIVSATTSRIKLPAEIVWILGSLLIAFIPGLPALPISPEIVFFIFLPPVLFAAAYFTSWRDFRSNLRPILLLSIGLVLFTAATVACVAHYLIPDCTWPMAFALGAIVSPPDASAATAIVRQLRVPRRIITIIEGESLMNDATALVILQFALAAHISGSISLSEAGGKFVLALGGSIVLGYVIGWLAIQVFKFIGEASADTVWTLLVAFSSYVIGEHLHLSGVITTVAAGLVFGRKFPELVTAQANVEAEATWRSVLFLLNGLAFSLMGLQLPKVLEGLTAYPTSWLVMLALVMAVIVISVRFIWVFPATYLPRVLIPSIREHDPSPPINAVATIGWIGMRGIVSLAAALSLPEDFPHRSLFLFLTYVVILTTLILPAVSMGLWVKVFKLKDDGEAERDRALAHLLLLEESLKTLEGAIDAKKFPVDHLKSHISKYQRKRDILKSNLSPGGFSPLLDLEQAHRRIQKLVLTAYRRKLSALRRSGEIHDHIFHEIRRELDNEELRLKGTLL